MWRGTCRSGTVACSSEKRNDGVVTVRQEFPKNAPAASVGTAEWVAIGMVAASVAAFIVETDLLENRRVVMRIRRIQEKSFR